MQPETKWQKFRAMTWSGQITIAFMWILLQIMTVVLFIGWIIHYPLFGGKKDE